MIKRISFNNLKTFSYSFINNNLIKSFCGKVKTIELVKILRAETSKILLNFRLTLKSY